MPKDNYKHAWKSSSSSGYGLTYQCKKCTESFTIPKDSMDTGGIAEEINKMLARRDCNSAKRRQGAKATAKA